MDCSEDIYAVYLKQYIDRRKKWNYILTFKSFILLRAQLALTSSPGLCILRFAALLAQAANNIFSLYAQNYIK